MFSKSKKIDEKETKPVYQIYLPDYLKSNIENVIYEDFDNPSSIEKILSLCNIKYDSNKYYIICRDFRDKGEFKASFISFPYLIFRGDNLKYIYTFSECMKIHNIYCQISEYVISIYEISVLPSEVVLYQEMIGNIINHFGIFNIKEYNIESLLLYSSLFDWIENGRSYYNLEYIEKIKNDIKYLYTVCTSSDKNTKSVIKNNIYCDTSCKCFGVTRDGSNIYCNKYKSNLNVSLDGRYIIHCLCNLMNNRKDV